MAPGVAVRLLRGAHPASRRLHGVRHRRPLVLPHSLRHEHHQGLPERPHAPRSPAQAVRRQLLEIRRPFHGFAWHLDGSLQDVPARWDLPHVTDEKFHLPRSRSARGTGSSSSTQIRRQSRSRSSDLSRPLRPLELARPLRAGTRVEGHCGQLEDRPEAFCEAFHVNATHPQILPYIGDTNSQVDVWENCSRAITPAATPSPLIDWAPDNETILRYALDVRLDEELFLTVKEGETARSAMADATATSGA